MNSKLKANPLIILFNRLRVLNPFSTSIPVYTKNDKVNPFLIIGSGRSGTTLLRSMLNQHHGIEIPPESYVLPIIYKRYKTYKKLPWPEFTKLILGEFVSHPHFHLWNLDIAPLYQKLESLKNEEQSLFKIIDSIYKLYASKNGKGNVIWGDKTPLNTFYIPEMNYMFKNPKYIHLKRDGRDVIASMLKYKLAENVKAASDRWLSAMKTAREIEQKSPDRILTVEYSELVQNPGIELKKICEFLSITFEPAMLDHTQNVDTLGDSVFNHHNNLKKPLSTDSIGNWQKSFEATELEWIENYIGKELTSNGYKLSKEINN